MSMSAAEVSAARLRLGLTLDAFAAETGFTPHVVSAWEVGTVAIPKRHEADLRWRLALQDRDDALRASGLPECAWIAHWHSQPFPVGLKAQTKHLESGVAHAKGCAVCIARDRFAHEKFGEVPKRPIPGGIGALAKVAEQVNRLPQWLRPVAIGALLSVVFTILQILFKLPELLKTSAGWSEMLLKLANALVIGVVVGVVISFARVAARWIAK